MLFTIIQPFAPSDADLLNCIGTVLVNEHSAFANNGESQRRNVGLWFEAQGTTIYGQLVARGAPTYASTSDLQVTIVVALD